MHNLVTELWDEWSAFDLSNPESVSSETAGLIAGLRAGKHEPDRSVSLASSRLWVLRRLLKLWKISRWGTRLNLAGRMLVPENWKGRVQLVFPEELYDEILRFVPLEPGEKAKTWDWVRGIWGSCGALYVPRSGYYLVIRTSSKDADERLRQILRRTHISGGGRTIHGKHELILRDQQEIVTFLSKIGLTGVSLLMEDKAILRAMRDQANRMRNCDTANIRKSLRVAEEQAALARRLQDEGLLPTLPLQLQELIFTRLKHPEASLTELGDALSPPITKSTVKYRWKRLCELVCETNDFE